ncbi:tyrosine-type recombinase/integrase [Mycolicibacterium tusciae]|uniref:tyrosine-type recombinase/integrase n=1 Tax=Mycolicibacterium tusciae TaxID=75922 RepID=UPI00024A26F7|nr:tyrosine-type recombinase/integrase [Mycolicibacterium tusciae]
MAHSKKRRLKSGKFVWEVEWVRPDGSVGTKRPFPTKKAADAYGVKQEEAKLRGVEYDPKAGGALFRDAAEKWLESRKGNARSNFGNHRSALTPAAQRRGDGKTLGIDAVFGGYPLNKITRTYIQEWVNRLTLAGKAASTVRHQFWTVRMVLEQAVVDGRLAKNPADHVRLPKESGTNGAKIGIVDRAQFLTAEQVAALVDAAPWPYNILVHLAAWSGLRAAELGGLQVGDVELPSEGHATLRVERTVRWGADEEQYGPTKTDSSMRRVPLPPTTTELIADYLAMHPRRNEPAAPLFPSFTLSTPKPTGKRTGDAHTRAAGGDPSSSNQTNETNKARARRQASALAGLSVADAEARIILDWDRPLRHANFYKGIFRPSVLRASRMFPGAALPPGCRFHSLRHSYASLCGEAGIPVRDVALFMGHANALTTEAIYTNARELHLMGENRPVA